MSTATYSTCSAVASWWRSNGKNLLAHAADTGHAEGRLTAPMPGKVIAVLVEVGAVVEKGTPLIVMEAMKMEHTIDAPAAGKVEEVLYAVGDQVDEGAQLLVIGDGLIQSGHRVASRFRRGARSRPPPPLLRVARCAHSRPMKASKNPLGEDGLRGPGRALAFRPARCGSPK